MDHVHNWVGCFHLWQWSSKISWKRLCECETSVTSVCKYVLRQCYNKEKYIYWIYIYIPANISMAAFISGKFWSFDAIFQPNGHIFVDSPSIQCQNSTWKLEYRFDEENSRWIRLSKSTKYRWVLHVDFSLSFQRRIDTTSILTVSIVSFPNIFCSENLF